MASLNTAARELVLKIVYYGPGLCGKTTTLQALHDEAPPERRGKLVSLATPVDRTLYFDFLPLRLPPLRGLAVRLQLFTVPGQVYFNATRRLVLSGADGVVFVADSQGDRLDANLESLENLRDNLAEHGRELATLPHAFAYNKRDLPDLVPLEQLDRLLNLHRAPSFGTVATEGEGAQSTLDAITRLVLTAYEAQLPEPTPSVQEVSIPAEAPSISVRRDGEEPDVISSADEPPAVRDAAADSGPPISVAGTAWRQELARLEERAAGARGVELEAARPTGISFSALFAPQERDAVEQIEQAIGRGEHSSALATCELVITRMLASVADIVGQDGAMPSPHDPALPLLLGLDGRRYLAFRALARRARMIGDVGIRDALESYAFVLEARVAFGQWDALRAAVGANSHPPPPRPSPVPPSGLPPLPRGSIAPPPRPGQT